jgi:lipid II:glycine glycyltransferase (peptidoglycan interpeptide bridge formation enzyme)
MKESYNAREWNQIISQLPEAHLLQTWEWGEVKKLYGWQPLPQTWTDDTGQVKCASLILRRTVSPLRLRVLYVPRGPLVDWSDAEWRERTLAEMELAAQHQHAIFIKIDPEVRLGTGVPGSENAQSCSTGVSLQNELLQRGWLYSPEQVQFRNTVMVDLTEPEEAWLARLKQKARYNLRLGEKRGVTIRVGTRQDLPMLYQMYAETSVRDGFLIRAQDYYDHLWKTFLEKDMVDPLIAEVDGQAVAGIMVYYFAGKAWYLQGMSTNLHREKMPNYLLQWTAMRRARARGCTCYDLWGAPENFSEADPLWGVFRFKESIGGQTIRTLGAWDFPAQPLLYSFYMRVLPRILNIMRRRGRERTRQEVIG